MTRRAWWWVAGIGAVLVAALLVAPLVIDGRRAIDIYRFLLPDAGSSELLPGGQVATEDLCSGVVGCVQAVDADTAVIRKFQTRQLAKERAAEAEQAGTDIHLSGWIVVEYKDGGLTEPERASLEQYIDGINVNSPD